MKNILKCPHCGYSNEIEQFPDLYCECEDKPEYQKQYMLLEMIQMLIRYNIVTCPNCGGVIIVQC